MPTPKYIVLKDINFTNIEVYSKRQGSNIILSFNITNEILDALFSKISKENNNMNVILSPLCITSDEGDIRNILWKEVSYEMTILQAESILSKAYTTTASRLYTISVIKDGPIQCSFTCDIEFDMCNIRLCDIGDKKSLTFDCYSVKFIPKSEIVKL